MTYGCKIMVLLTVCHFLDHPVHNEYVHHTIDKLFTAAPPEIGATLILYNYIIN